jgi:2-amino-4-hydroxy-6-hydroxymethyldihydropteridine diphosphokinase
MEPIVALGTNVAFGGASGGTLLARAAEALGPHGLIVRRRSSFWLSPAWPDPSDPPFVNACMAVAAPGLDPPGLLTVLHEVEAAFGRVRGRRNAPRTLDLDLIAWGDLIIEDGGGLEIPHPRLAGRAFVLAPLSEIVPGWRHPRTGESVEALLQAAADRDQVRRWGGWDDRSAWP